MKSFIFKLLGPFLAIAGVLGLTGSSILWNFQGRGLGLPATIASLLTLAVGVVLLRPLPEGTTPTSAESSRIETSAPGTSVVRSEAENPQEITPKDSIQLEDDTEGTVSADTIEQKNSLTTTEAIAAQLAAEEASKEEAVLVNFAPDALRPGNAIRSNKRSPGRNLSGYREMASELFKTN